MQMIINAHATLYSKNTHTISGEMIRSYSQVFGSQIPSPSSSHKQSNKLFTVAATFLVLLNSCTNQM